MADVHLLREYAGRAMQALMTTEWFQEQAMRERGAGSPPLSYDVAVMSYGYAQAMVEEDERLSRERIKEERNG